MPVVDNMVLCTSKFVFLTNLMLSVLTRERERETYTKGMSERFWMSLALTVVIVSLGFAYVQTHQIVHIICAVLGINYT